MSMLLTCLSDCWRRQSTFSKWGQQVTENKEKVSFAKCAQQVTETKKKINFLKWGQHAADKNGKRSTFFKWGAWNGGEWWNCRRVSMYICTMICWQTVRPWVTWDALLLMMVRSTKSGFGSGVTNFKKGSDHFFVILHSLIQPIFAFISHKAICISYITHI